MTRSFCQTQSQPMRTIFRRDWESLMCRATGGQSFVQPLVFTSTGFHCAQLRTPCNATALNTKSLVLSFGQSAAPVFPTVLAAFPSDLLISITTIDPNIKNSYSQQANVQIESGLIDCQYPQLGLIRPKVDLRTKNRTKSVSDVPGLNVSDVSACSCVGPNRIHR